MELRLSVDDLAITYKETFTARDSWYNLGLALEVSVATLDSLASCSREPKELLREMLKAWLKRAHQPTWQSLVDALNNPIVDEPRLADALDSKYCKTGAPQQQPISDMQLLQQQVVANTEAVAEFKEGLLEKEHTLEDLQETVAARSFQIQEFQQQVSLKKAELDDTVLAQGLRVQEVLTKVSERKAQRQEHVRPSVVAGRKESPSVELNWRKEPFGPVDTSSERFGKGTVAVDGRMVYFATTFDGLEGSCKAYNAAKKLWSSLPVCPLSEFSFAIVNGLLTAIGGGTSADAPTNVLLSLVGKWYSRKWKWSERFPPMPTKRRNTTVAYTHRVLVVAGGHEKSNYLLPNTSSYLDAVEVMDTETLQWSTASNLPHPFAEASAAICGDTLYLLGGRIHGDRTQSVLTCSLSGLLQSCKPQSLGSDASEIWQKAANVPVSLSTCVSLSGHLLAVGGENSDYQRTNCVYALNQTTNAWEVIGRMPTARASCLVAVLPDNEVMVVGGWTDGSSTTRAVEIAKYALVTCV